MEGRGNYDSSLSKVVNVTMTDDDDDEEPKEKQ